MKGEVKMSSATEEKAKETIDIVGMTCVGCARTLENEFRKFDGVDYSVSLADKNIAVTYAPAQYKREDFEKAIESHGYRIKGKQY
jgi:copper chaperone CopZ